MRRRTKEKRRSKEFSEETEVMVVLGLIMTHSKARTQQYIGRQLMLDLNKNLKYLEDGRLDANHRQQTLLRSPQPDREEHSPRKTQQKNKKNISKWSKARVWKKREKTNAQLRACKHLSLLPAHGHPLRRRKLHLEIETRALLAETGTQNKVGKYINKLSVAENGYIIYIQYRARGADQCEGARR
jgi:hypothetical protein